MNYTPSLFPAPPIKAEFALFQKVSALFTRHGIKHWIDFGTLLGAVRGGGFIRGDQDIDIDVFEDETSKILALRSEIEALGITTIFEPTSLLWRLQQKGHGDNVLFMDIYICQRQNNWVAHALPSHSFPFFYVESLDTILFENETWPCPKHARYFLRHRYGTYWQIPLPREQYVQDGGCVGFFKHAIPFPRETTAYVNGVFDLFHIGHLRILERAKELFGRLVVGVHNDATVESYKRTPIIPYEQRFKIICSLDLADLVVADSPLTVTQGFLRSHGADYFVAGEAPAEMITRYWSDLHKNDLLHFLPRTSAISSTDIIKRCQIYQNQIDGIHPVSKINAT